MNAVVIDAFEFCRLNERRAGEIGVAELPRLSAETVDNSGMLHWVLQGGAGRLGHPKLTLSVAGPIQLICQRCLQPFAFDIVSESGLILAPDEDAADEIDALLDDDQIDVIAVGKSLDITTLIEDEALLNIPLSPKHDSCEGRLEPKEISVAGRASPFAGLKDLKQ